MNWLPLWPPDDNDPGDTNRPNSTQEALELITRSQLSVRLAPACDFRASLQSLAENGLGGVILEAIGQLAPRELSQTGRREIRALLRSAGLQLGSVALPMRRSIAEKHDWDQRIARLTEAMNLAYKLGSTLVSISPGPAPVENAADSIFAVHLQQLAGLAAQQGVTVVIEPGIEPADQHIKLIRQLGHPSLGIALDPGRLLLSGQSLERVANESHDLVRLLYATDPEFMGLGTFGHGKTVAWEEVKEIVEEMGYRLSWNIWPGPSMPMIDVAREMGRRLGATPLF